MNFCTGAYHALVVRLCRYLLEYSVYFKTMDLELLILDEVHTATITFAKQNCESTS